MPTHTQPASIYLSSARKSSVGHFLPHPIQMPSRYPPCCGTPRTIHSDLPASQPAPPALATKTPSPFCSQPLCLSLSPGYHHLQEAPLPDYALTSVSIPAQNLNTACSGHVTEPFYLLFRSVYQCRHVVISSLPDSKLLRGAKNNKGCHL